MKLHPQQDLDQYGKVKGQITPTLPTRGATEQSTLDERGKFHENLIPILRVECSCIYNNL